MQSTSCGVIVLCPEGELLLCHATGTAHWDIPKGMQEAGEAGTAAAVREAAEECGLQVEARWLRPLGLHPYRPQKQLDLYALLSERFDVRRCHCNSQFRDRLGRLRPEMDRFQWVPYAGIGALCARNMAHVLTGILDLPRLGAVLAAEGAPRKAMFVARDA